MHDLTTPQQSDAWMGIVPPDRVRRRELASDEVLFHQDDPVMALYRLETGQTGAAFGGWNDGHFA
jgi:hypothetical protein